MKRTSPDWTEDVDALIEEHIRRHQERLAAMTPQEQERFWEARRDLLLRMQAEMEPEGLREPST